MLHFSSVLYSVGYTVHAIQTSNRTFIKIISLKYVVMLKIIRIKYILMQF